MARRYLITKQPERALCDVCQAPVLRGIDEGMSYVADPTPITGKQEARCMIRGRHTYVLRFGRLIWRDTGTVGLPGPVLPGHKHGEQLAPYGICQKNLDFGLDRGTPRY